MLNAGHSVSGHFLKRNTTLNPTAQFPLEQQQQQQQQQHYQRQERNQEVFYRYIPTHNTAPLLPPLWRNRHPSSSDRDVNGTQQKTAADTKAGQCLCANVALVQPLKKQTFLQAHFVLDFVHVVDELLLLNLPRAWK